MRFSCDSLPKKSLAGVPLKKRLDLAVPLLSVGLETKQRKWEVGGGDAFVFDGIFT